MEKEKNKPVEQNLWAAFPPTCMPTTKSCFSGNQWVADVALAFSMIKRPQKNDMLTEAKSLRNKLIEKNTNYRVTGVVLAA